MIPAASVMGTALLRLSTEGRLVLCGLSTKMIERFREHDRWIFHGNLSAGDQLVIMPAMDGCRLSKDGRFFITNGQRIHRLTKEAKVEITSYPSLVTARIIETEDPSLLKTQNMAQRPFRLPSLKLDPGATYLFDELLPSPKRKS